MTSYSSSSLAIRTVSETFVESFSVFWIVFEVVEHPIIMRKRTKIESRFFIRFIFYKINSEHKNLVGVYLSSNKIEIIITDSLGNEQNRFSTPIKNNNEITKEILHSEIASVIKKYDLKDKIKMISIGIPGVLDENNYIADIPTLPKLDKINLKKFLTEKLELPVIIENDVNLIAKALHDDEQYKKYHKIHF